MRYIKSIILAATIVLLTGCATSTKTLHKKAEIGSVSPEYNLNRYMQNISNSTFVNYINEIRAKGSVCSAPTTPLAGNVYLEKAAFAHAKDMAANHKLEHYGSGNATDIARKRPGVGSFFFERLIFFGYPAKANDLVGENITHIKFRAVGSKDRFESFKRAIKVFLADPPHCKILMEPRFKDVGVGYAKTADGYYWVIDFGETE